MNKSVATMKGFTQNIIKIRKEEMMKERKEKNQNEIDEMMNKKKRLALLDLLLKLHLDDGSINEDVIREEVDTFVFTGHDTTGIAMVGALFEIGHHPEVQQQLHDEIDSVFGENKTRPVTSDDIKELKYLDMVIKESLRLHPSAPVVARHLTDDLDIGGFTLPKDSNVGMPIILLHRNEDIYPEPNKFDPLRFTLDEQINRHPFAYIPFSGGSRGCIGMKFAQLEKRIIITNILRNFTIKTMGNREDFEQDVAITLMINSPVKMEFTAR